MKKGTGMKDGLNQEQKASAWDLTRSPAFEGTAIIDPDGKIVFAYPQFCEILKLSPAEIEGIHFADFFPFPHKPIVKRNVAQVMSGSKETYTDEVMMRLPDGRNFPAVVMFGARFLHDGKLDFVIKRIMESQGKTLEPLALSSESPRMTPWQWLKNNVAMLCAIAGGAAIIIGEILKHLHGVQ